MRKIHHNIVIALLAVVILTVGILSYNGLNGMGYHSLVERLERGTVSFWYTDESMTNYYNNVASVYNKSHAGVNVVPKLVTAMELLEHIYQASIEGEDFPDLYVLSSDNMEKAYLSGLTLAIEDEALITESFPSVAVKAASYNGSVQAYPFYFDTSVLVYNKSLLEEIALDQFRLQAEAEGTEFDPSSVTSEQIAGLVNAMIPSTIDDLTEFSNNLEAPDGLETLFKWNINDVFYNYFYLGKYISLDPDHINIYNEQSLACMEIFKSVTEYFYMDAETVDEESILEEFLAGRVLFTIMDTSSAIALEEAKASGEVEFDYDFARIPDPSAELQGSSLSVTSLVVVNGYADQPDTANDFAKYLTIDSTAQMYEKTHYIPAYKNVSISSNLENVFKMEYNDSASMPGNMATSNFWMLLEIAFNEIWDGADPAAELQSLEQTMIDQLPSS